MDRFRRNLHLVEPSLPHNLNNVEILALMRHFGAPTRLVDFTYSFYVGLFFAIDNLEGKDPVLLAINAPWLVKQAERYLDVIDKGFMPGKCRSCFKNFFSPDAENEIKQFVYHITPDRFNKRLSVQQGTFLCPSDIRKTFEDNLKAMLTEVKDYDIKSNIKVIRICRSKRKDFLLKLYRMNINRASLFPDLDGLAQFLSSMLLSKSTINIYKEKRKALLLKKKTWYFMG